MTTLSDNMDDYRFKFKKYPELFEMYKVYRKLRLNVTKWSMKESEKAGVKMDQAILDQDTYSRTIFAKAIYDIFNPLKPKLYDTYDKCRVKWDEHFGKKAFEELTDTEKRDLVGLIAKDFNYELPKKYYNKGRGRLF